MSTIYNLDTANLFTGDDDPDHSQYLVIDTIKLPSFEEATKEVKPGGGVMSIKMRTKSIAAPVLGFNLVGVQPRVMRNFLKPSREKYTMRGNLYDVRRQEDLAFVVVVEGRMTKVELKEFKKEGDISTEYEINEVVKYKLHIDGEEEVYFDFFAGPAGIRINGNKRFSRAARNIGLGA